MAKPLDKKQTLLAFLERGVAMVHLDARRPGVVVPKSNAEDPHLLLNFSYRYAIPDLTIDDRGVVATLSFRNQPFRCTLPWTAIFGVTSQVDGQGQVWPEDLPDEVVEQFQSLDSAESGESGDEGAAAKTPRKIARKPKAKMATRPALRAIDQNPAATPAPAPAPAVAEREEPAPERVEAPRPPSRGHLRLVK